ncbi:MAG: hypothetical protein LBH16_02640 [Treponema sp.]|jgi:hypothetical protein|nr:hypothetical protein [Treponema sp.]
MEKQEIIMVEIKDLTKIEREILTLAAREETTILNFDLIQEKFKLKRNEAEETVDGLIKKGMAELKHYDSDPKDVIYCKMKHGISNNQYVDLKKLEDDYMADMALRARVCP